MIGGGGGALTIIGGKILEEMSSKDRWDQRMRLGVCSHTDRVAMGRNGGKYSSQKEKQRQRPEGTEGR